MGFSSLWHSHSCCFRFLFFQRTNRRPFTPVVKWTMKREASRTIQPSKDAQSAASASFAARPGLRTLAESTRIPTPEPPSLDHLSGISFRDSDPCRMPHRHAHNCLLCFHNLTNSFSRNPFPLISIQIAGGCHPPFTKSSPVNTSPGADWRLPNRPKPRRVLCCAIILGFHRALA